MALQGLGDAGSVEKAAGGVDMPGFLAERDTAACSFPRQRKREEGWTEITCKVYFTTAENYTEEKYYSG